MLCIGFLCVLLSCTFRRHIYLNNGLTIFRKSFHWIKMSRTTIALSKYCVLFFFWVKFNLCNYPEMFALTDFRLSSMNNTHCREHIRTKPGWLLFKVWRGWFWDRVDVLECILFSLGWISDQSWIIFFNSKDARENVIRPRVWTTLGIQLN